ncbi:hypothetical protein I3842_05G157800 [Carya illinoinensis]|uniref:Protein SLOW GREEN 1, chloroplastic n=1 Tax=Carya illinoinensis TaxID=32201 RepID=A0A922JQU3_CARIL|nr:hypothetical protein I3842_05G157800 [Carya illinoinensis]
MSFTLAALSSSSSSSSSITSLSSSISTTKPSSSSSYLRFSTPNLQYPHSRLKVFACATHTPNVTTEKSPPPIVRTLGRYTKAALFVCATAAMIAKLSVLPARAESPTVLSQQTPILEEEQDQAQAEAAAQDRDLSSPLSELLESNSEAVETLKSLLQENLENGEDEQALKILRRLVAAQPSATEWKFLMGRLLNEMGDAENARRVFEEILALDPLSFEALFENALIMDRCGEGEAVIKRLEDALNIALEENKAKEARDVRFIMAQIQFLQKNVEEALRTYQDLAKEDPKDFRPYFCMGMIYSLQDRNAEARDQFAKYRELSPKKYEVEGYLRTPLSRMKLFGSNEN